MGTYIARRLIWTPILLLIVSFVTFAMVQLAPGDPIQIRMGQHNDPEAVKRIRDEMGLNDPIPIQYARYIGNVARGDFGKSLQYQGRSVSEIVLKRVAVSAQLNLAGLIVSLGLGIPLGLYAALKQGTGWDVVAVSGTLVGQSLPVFLTAPVLLIVFALKLDVLPTHGWEGFFSPNIILPALVLGIPGVAILARITRASTLDVLVQDYIRTARAKGLPERLVRSRHILRNSLIPIVTIMGFSMAGMASGSFIVEIFFGIPGAGLLAIESLFARDFMILMAVVLLGTTLFVLANLIVDLTYPIMDPRIRLRGGHVAG